MTPTQPEQYIHGYQQEYFPAQPRRDIPKATYLRMRNLLITGEHYNGIAYGVTSRNKKIATDYAVLLQTEGPMVRVFSNQAIFYDRDEF